MDRRNVLADLVQRFIGSVNRKAAGRSTSFMHQSGLTFPQIIVLYALRARSETISGLAATLRMSMGATSQLVDRLVEAKMVERIESVDDRRVRTVSLRSRGERYLATLGSIRNEEISAALSTVSPSARASLEKALAVVVAELETPPDGGTSIRTSKSSTPRRR